MDFFKNEVSFYVGKQKISFNIYSEIEDLEPAFTNWIYRTDIYTAKNFVEYVKEKDSSIHIYTEKEYNRLIKNN